MLKNLIYIICFLSLFKGYAQALSAKVVDENNDILSGATVYFDGTTRGVITDLDGVFNIDIPVNVNNPMLVITYLGYQPLYVKDLENLQEVYQLTPKPESLNAVNLYSSPFSRAQMLEVFKKYFLGRGKPASNCEILNMDDVILYYVVDENTLYAKSYTPIQIKNDYLGYHITFDLLDFQVKYNTLTLSDNFAKQTFYAGTSFFEDIDPKKNKARDKIYKSSLSKFFKDLINKDLEKSKFKIAYKGFVRNPHKIFRVERQDSTNFIYNITLKNEVISLFKGKYVDTRISLLYKRDQTDLLFKKPSFRVDEYGNLIDILDVILIGHLSDSRIAELLPTNYTSNE